jgi:hypothetical protein
LASATASLGVAALQPFNALLHLRVVNGLALVAGGRPHCLRILFGLVNFDDTAMAVTVFPV